MNDDLTNLISRYYALCMVCIVDKDYDRDSYVEMLEVEGKIMLMLSMEDSMEQSVEEQVKACNEAVGLKDEKKLKAELDKLIEISRIMIKYNTKKAQSSTLRGRIKRVSSKVFSSGLIKYRGILISINVILLGLICLKSMKLIMSLGVILFFNGIVGMTFSLAELFKIEEE